ncbi:MAG: acetolactate synthase large subunit [Deltaproteobacteria bacterium]|nr:acetolactate synthase large subunit [Deltaproteobacteria bacterium]
MRASELFIRCLENEGVETIFGLPGEENIDVMDALVDSKIRFVTTRHEQGAAFMADVYGRLTQRAGVCLSTLGPGATNLITGVADANMDHAPLVAITGQASLDRMHKESHQYLDTVASFRPLTKWSAQIRRASIIPEVVRKAFKIAQTEKLGATHIDFPEDEAAVEISGEPLKAQFAAHPEPPEEKVREAAELISGARHPIVLAGNGVIRGGASEALRRFASRLNIPVANTFMAKGVLSLDDPLSLFSVGLQTRDYVSCGFERADVVICVGYDLVEYAPVFWNPEGDKRIVHVDMSPADVDAHYVVATGVTGDIGESLDRIAALARPSEANSIVKLRDQLVHEIHERYREDGGFPIKPQRALADIRSVLGPEDLLISDVGAHKVWIARCYPCYVPNTCIISNGFASMGIALPGGVAAALLYKGRPGRRVVALSGDAGFLMNVQELQTAIEQEVAFVNIIFRDDGYGLIRWKQLRRFGRESHVSFRNPDFLRLAEAFGCRGYRVQGPNELAPALREALSQKVPSVIECPVDYAENLKLTEELGALVCPV